MKTTSQQEPADGLYSKAFHKLVEGRSRASVTLEHRYERRKVREFLRHLDSTLEEEPFPALAVGSESA